MVNQQTIAVNCQANHLKRVFVLISLIPFYFVLVVNHFKRKEFWDVISSSTNVQRVLLSQPVTDQFNSVQKITFSTTLTLTYILEHLYTFLLALQEKTRFLNIFICVDKKQTTSSLTLDNEFNKRRKSKKQLFLFRNVYKHITQ